LFTLNYWLKPTVGAAKPAGIVQGSIWGAIAGFTSFGVHAGGPPVNFFLLPQRLDKSIYVGTTILMFAVVNYTKLIPYTWLGQFTVETLWTSLALSILAPIGIGIGVRLHHLIREDLFYRFCYLFLFLTGLKLVYDALA
ncbi:MAG: sulfite exporter TauE/SafE family protein, partial [Rhodospirillales bacterium]